jgi:hypothetical protein
VRVLIALCDGGCLHPHPRVTMLAKTNGNHRAARPLPQKKRARRIQSP